MFQLSALKICLRNVVVDGNKLDLRRFINKEIGVVFDGCQVYAGLGFEFDVVVREVRYFGLSTCKKS